MTNNQKNLDADQADAAAFSGDSPTGSGSDAMDDDESTRALAGGEVRIFKGAHGLVRKLRDRASGGVNPLSIDDDVLADLPTGFASTGENGPAARPESDSPIAAPPLAALNSRPNKKTILTMRPALAGTGETEAYGRAEKGAVLAAIDSKRKQLIVDAGADDSEETWVSGAGEPIARPRLSRCRLNKRTESGFAVKRADGTVFMLPLERVLAVGIGVVSDHPRPEDETLFFDVVTSWGRRGAGAVVLRFDTTLLPLKSLFTERIGHIAAVVDLTRELASRPRSRRMPNTADWPGPPFVRYANESAMDVAFYGPEKS